MSGRGFADVSGVFAQVRAAWRRDRAILWPLAGLFLFVPQFAILLLVPPMPATDPAASLEAWAQALEPWVSAYAGWYVAATVLSQFGALAVVSLYMAPAVTTGGALARAGRLFARALLAGLLVTMPCGMAALVSLPIPLLPMVVLPGIVYVLGRTTLANPVILAERGRGAVQAVVRSWQLTRGRGVPIALIVGGVTIGGQALGAIVVSVERAVRGGALASPLLIAAIDALAAGIACAAALALALVQVVLYRRLAR